MTITINAYENTATISTTEYSLVSNSTSLSADTNVGIYQVFIDFAAMGAADEYKITIKEKVVAAGTQRIIFSATLVGVQSAPAWVSPSLILGYGWDVTVTKIAGTDRSIGWSIRKVA